MSDELEKLESALQATTPLAPAPVRERTISEAMAAFSRHHQGIGDAARHRGRAPKPGAFTQWIRRLAMPLSRPSLAFAGSAALAVTGLITYQILVTQNLPYPSYQPPPSPAATPVQPPGDEAGITAVQPVGDEARGAAQKAQDRGTMTRSLEATGMEESVTQPQSEDDGWWSRVYRADELSGGLMALSGPAKSRHPEYQGGDRFTEFSPNPVKVAAEEPVSTFSIDVDTASYAFLRASLNYGYLPQDTDAVRTEELINYFAYDYAPPETRDPPFAAHVSLMPAPWNGAARLMHIGIKGYEIDRSDAPRANLVFLIDTSGSMDEPNKLPLLIRSFKLLLTALAPDDRVAIVAYAGSAGVVLEPTPAADRKTILAGLERLGAGGSTAGAEGIRQAYLLAERHLVEDGVNRVILATDGDFNVGMTDTGELEEFISRKRESGVSLSVLGFGMGNYNDDVMQHLAQSGNGNAAYIDSLSEARKVLLEEVTSTLVTIAKDVKIQVEFNPAAVREYRLIGYETRMLAREDFRNDKVDAGEIGAGHTVTAIYEVILADSDGGLIPPLRYQETGLEPGTEFNDEFAFLKIRYKQPDAETSTLITRPVTVADAFRTVEDAPRDVRFAAAVAAFGELLHGGRYTGEYGYDDVVSLAQGARGDDPYGYRNEFIRLVRIAQSVTATDQ